MRVMKTECEPDSDKIDNSPCMPAFWRFIADACLHAHRKSNFDKAPIALTFASRAKSVTFLTRFAGESALEGPPRLTRTALDVGGPCVENASPARTSDDK